jgi:hypothetical protein
VSSAATNGRAGAGQEVRLPKSQLRELARLVAAELADRQAGPGLTVREARQYIGVSDEFFRAEVMPEVAIVRRGKRRIYPRGDLDRWLLHNAQRLPAELVAGDNHEERRSR